MKKSLLLFLAISSLSFAAASTTTGANANLSNNNDTTSATIDVNVTANVFASETQLIITDESGEQISAVNFEHNLTQTGSALIGETELTKTILAKANGINGNKLTASGLNIGNNSFSLVNIIDGNHTSIEGNLNLSQSTQTVANQVPYVIASTITSNATATEGTYTTDAKKLTITFNKRTVSN